MSEMLKLVAKSKLQDQSQPHRIPLPPCSWQNQNQRQSSPPPSLRAVCSLVVSPPISTVIPWILPAIYVPPSWLWVKEKSRSLDSSQNYYLGSKLQIWIYVITFKNNSLSAIKKVKAYDCSETPLPEAFAWKHQNELHLAHRVHLRIPFLYYSV